MHCAPRRPLPFVQAPLRSGYDQSSPFAAFFPATSSLFMCPLTQRGCRCSSVSVHVSRAGPLCWYELSVLALNHSVLQLPRPRSVCVESMGDLLRRFPARNRTRSCACMLDTYLHEHCAHAHLAGWGTVARNVGRPTVGRSYHGPPPSNQGLSDPASLLSGGVFLPCASRTPDVCRL